MILVTGASGFIGLAVSKALGDQAIAISRSSDVVIDGGAIHVVSDLTEDKSADELAAELGSQQITHIIHVAAITPWSTNPDFSLDLKIAKTICQLSNKLKIPNLYFISGWIVYDAHAEVPFSEDVALMPSTQYGESKVMTEKYFRQNLTQTNLANLRLASVYGPGQTSPGLITNFVADAFKKKTITLNAKKTRRDYLFIGDLVRGIRGLLNLDLGGRTDLNIGSGESISVLEVAQTIKTICKESYGLDITLEFAPDLHESDIQDNRVSVEKAHGLGILMKMTPMKEGLEAYIAWAKNENIL